MKRNLIRVVTMMLLCALAVAVSSPTYAAPKAGSASSSFHGRAIKDGYSSLCRLARHHVLPIAPGRGVAVKPTPLVGADGQKPSYLLSSPTASHRKSLQKGPEYPGRLTKGKVSMTGKPHKPRKR